MRFALGAATIGVGVVGGIARNKWVAHHLGAAGIGIVGQLTAVQTWLGLAAALGLGIALPPAFGAALGQNDEDRVRRIAWTAFQASASAVAVVAVFGFLFAPFLATQFLADGTLAPLVRISMIGVAGYAAHSLASGLFAGHTDVRAPFTLALASAITGVALTFALVPGTGTPGAVLAVSVMLVVGVAAALTIHRRRYAAVLAGPAPIDRDILRALLGIGAAGLVLALVDQGVMLAARAHLIRREGVEANGLLQAGLAFSQQVGGVFYVYLSNYVLGRVSRLDGAPAIRDYTRRQWRPLIGLAALAFATALLFAGPFLRLFYSERFVAARPLAAWLLLGEYAKVVAQCWVISSLPLGGLKLWLPLVLSFPLAMGLSYVVLVAAGVGLMALPWAYASAGLVGLVAVGIAMSRAGVTLSKGDLAVLAAASLPVGVLALVIGR
jgi:O-antigen/teichoic acid export membrane protein